MRELTHSDLGALLLDNTTPYVLVRRAKKTGSVREGILLKRGKKIGRILG